MQDSDWNDHRFPGYRLKRLEVTNWGTFDSRQGQVHSLAPGGVSSLLVGQNGSGKSTLVDAILTLLVQPGVRNYNVAAGAKKRERDERTYIRGACGRSSDEESGSVTDYLRPDDNHYSVVLGSFERSSTGEAFTVAQVLQVTGDGEVDKTYAFAADERTIADDLSGLSRGEKIRKQLQERGFKATTKFSEYQPWFTKFTKMRPKAMDVFNQTVAVKDIQSLNRFIREHMLEAKPWRERIEGLLSHFSQLSQAHQALVKARRQIELLAPIEEASETLAAVSLQASRHQTQMDTIDSYFRNRINQWLKPQIETSSKTIESAQQRKSELEQEINALDDTQRYFKNEIEKTGGERLRQLPLQLETKQTLLESKERESNRLNAALRLAGLEVAILGKAEFDSLPQLLAQRQSELAESASDLAARRLELARELTDQRSQLDKLKTQLEIQEQQSGHLPGPLLEIRQSLAEHLGIPATEMPFVAELVAIRPAEEQWQSSIEMILRSFASTLLVDAEHEAAARQFLSENELVDRDGVGQTISVACAAETETRPPANLHQDSMLAKLDVREHEFSGWVTNQLHRHFDYRCCSDLAELLRCRGPACLSNRLVRTAPKRFQKDDRTQSQNPQHYLLGWDNSERTSQLQSQLAELQVRESETASQLEDLEKTSKQLARRSSAIETAQSFDSFQQIDAHSVQAEIRKLEDERLAIEQSNDAVRVLRERLEETIARRFAAQQERDSFVARESNSQREVEQFSSILERNQQLLSERRQRDEIEDDESAYAELHELFGQRIGEVSELSHFAELQTEATGQLQRSLTELNARSEPLRTDIVRCMQKFLSESPEERDDLRADLLYLDGFLGLLGQLRRDDLPKYEKRFQERLNEKVIQELGVFHAALQCEKQEIVEKVEVLNRSLQQLEYRVGTFMRLEPRPVADREIKDFQAALRACIAEEFAGDPREDERRFSEIEKFVRRLREEERWRDKVTDVRRWFDFAARELERATGDEKSCYEDSSGQSGGEKAKLAFTILVAAIAYQFDIDPDAEDDDRFHFVVVDEMFSKVDDRYAEYAMQLFEKFGLQLLIVAPLDAKARVTEPYVGCFLHTVKDEDSRTSQVFSMTADEYAATVGSAGEDFSTQALLSGKPK